MFGVPKLGVSIPTRWCQVEESWVHPTTGGAFYCVSRPLGINIPTLPCQVGVNEVYPLTKGAF